MVKIHRGQRLMQLLALRGSEPGPAGTSQFLVSQGLSPADGRPGTKPVATVG